MSDKTTEYILAALKQALIEPGEHRLYRSGKLAGLFASRAGAVGDAAARALRDGLLEVVRSEAKGKVTIEWVKLAPAGVEFLHEHESPAAALRELQAALKTTQAGVPAWLAQMEQDWQRHSVLMQEQVKQALRRLDTLAGRVEEALRRLDAIGPELPAVIAQMVPWAGEALAYLEKRKQSGAEGGCPLPELFAAVRRHKPELALSEFQTGLRRLAEHKALRLLPFEGQASELPHPEYALLDGAKVLYYAGR